MAYDANIFGGFSGRSAYRIKLYTRRDSVSGNSSSYAWQLFAEKIAAGTTYALNQYPWSVNVAGYGFSGSNNLDFRNTNSITLGSGGTGWVGHDGNGNLNIGMSASMNAGGTLFGSASAAGSMATDRIAQVPGPMIPRGLDQITSTSMVYRFEGTTDGGATIDLYQIQYSAQPDFTGSAPIIASNGTSTIGGLTPGTTYYFRSRGHNAAGYGPWASSILAAKTLSGAYVGKNGTLQPAAVFVGKNNAWQLVEVRVGKAGNFVIAS